NSTATVNYYRAYTNAFSYFAIVGEKAQAAQTSPPAAEPPKETVKEETTDEQPKEPDAPVVEEPKATPPYFTYVIAVIILLVAAYAATKIKATKEDKAPRNEPVSEPTAKYFVPHQGKKPEIPKTRIAAQKNNLDDIEKRLDAIRRKLKE
ncbi:hypothetical protein L6303_03445, partial [archaeon]|nr:hypothetical protein [archaeon]